MGLESLTISAMFLFPILKRFTVNMLFTMIKEALFESTLPTLPADHTSRLFLKRDERTKGILTHPKIREIHGAATLGEKLAHSNLQ